MPLIPKKPHAIWLGSFPPQDAKANVLAWRDTNPDHESNLWIDSRTYPAEKKEEFDALKQWAADNNIILRDLNGSDKSLYEKMLNKKYYDEEMRQPFANFAAAADILRTEFLYEEGGKYHDIRDVFPYEHMGELNPELGFLCRWRYHYNKQTQTYDPGTCNDLLASVPKGEIIAAYRNIIRDNYENLHKNPKAVKAHRDYTYLYPGVAGRYESTISLSGPGALNDTLEFYISSHNEDKMIVIDELTAFPEECYALPAKQKNDWYNNKYIYQHPKEVIRNYCRIYLVGPEIFI